MTYPDDANHRPNSTPGGRRGMGLVGALLERAARATPATVENRDSEWWLRHTGNDTWWSGAVLAHGPANGLTERVDAAERFYAEHAAPARFQVCVDCPTGLDRCLSERGYRRDVPVALLTTIGTPIKRYVPPGITVRVDTSPTPDWLAVLAATGAPETDVEHETRLLGRVAYPRAYVTILAAAEPVGIGRAVADDGWTGVFTTATTPPARRRGIARLTLSTIAHWATAHEAPRLYLQVERSNNAAHRLYQTAGFTHLTTYHYRVRPLSTTR